jgi:hypothetical protein
MGIKALIQIAATLAVLAVSSGKLPVLLKDVHVARPHLLKYSQASKWGSRYEPQNNRHYLFVKS